MPFQHYLYSKNRAHNTGTCTGTFSKISCGLRAVFWKHLFPTSSFLRTNRTQVQLNTIFFRKLPSCTLPKNMYMRMRFITNVQKQGWRNQGNKGTRPTDSGSSVNLISTKGRGRGSRLWVGWENFQCIKQKILF